MARKKDAGRAVPPQGPSARRPKRPGPARKTSAPPPSGAGELIDMAEAVSILKTTQPTFYRWLKTGKIKGVKIGRQWRFQRADIERFLTGEAPPIVLAADITPLLEMLRARLREVRASEPPANGSNEVRRAVRLMIALGVATNASDIHITTHMTPDGNEPETVLRYRVDGVLYEKARIDTRLLPAIIEDWKRLAGCDVHEKALPQDGRIIMRLPGAKDDKREHPLDLRVCFIPTALGESLTARLLLPGAVAFGLDKIDYAPRDRERLRRAIRLPWGIVLITGPTGCGKTTVLYSCMNDIARPEFKIMTIEDPVEYYLPWATQIAVNAAAGRTFPRVIRSILRSDPDVIMVGEVRNLEVLSMCQQAALTGHLVLSTLHTDDAPGALRRMVEMGSDPFLVADSTKLVLAQRLIRKLCVHCSVEDKEPSATRLDLCARAALKGGLNWHSLVPRWRKPVGCDKCSKTGYKGRTVIAEVLEVTPEIGRALRNNSSLEELRAIAVGQGMTDMAADGLRRAATGETSLDEVMRVGGIF